MSDNSKSKTCAAKGCTKNVAAHMLMCRGHWFQVPKPIRASIWSLHKRVQDGDESARGEHLGTCREAVQSLIVKGDAS